MTNFDHDDLPPDLADLGRRMREERPVADDAALARMTRRTPTPSRQTPRRAPRRAFAVSLATMFAMVSVTGVAAAALFGANFSLLGQSLSNSSRNVGTASSQALRAPAPTSSARLPATIGSAAGALGSIPGGSPSTNQVGANLFNAGQTQYGSNRLICRILRALGLRFIARLLGC
jgi:hypothetical protein